MAFIRWVEIDTFTNKDISAATVIGSYTVLADGKIKVRFEAAQIVGGGDYVAYISITPSGGVEGPVLPKSTLPVAAGEMVIRGQSGEIDVKTGDVVKLYLDGLAGDTTTPDTTVEWGLVELADGEVAEIQAGLATAAALTVVDGIVDAILVDTGTTLDGRMPAALVGGRMDASVGAMASDVLTAAKIAADAIAEIQSGLATAANFATLLALLTASETVLANVTAGDITQYRGDYWSIALTGLGDLTDYVSIDFMIKRNKDEEDTEALLWVRKNASGLTDGLLRVNGAAAAAPYGSTDGSLTPDAPLTGGTATLVVKAIVTDDLPASHNGLYFEVQAIFASGPVTRRAGAFYVAEDVVRAIS